MDVVQVAWWCFGWTLLWAAQLRGHDRPHTGQGGWKGWVWQAVEIFECFFLFFFAWNMPVAATHLQLCCISLSPSCSWCGNTHLPPSWLAAWGSVWCHTGGFKALCFWSAVKCCFVRCLYGCSWPHGGPRQRLPQVSQSQACTLRQAERKGMDKWTSTDWCKLVCCREKNSKAKWGGEGTD